MARKFFDPENNLWSWIGRIPEIVILSALWVLMSLPIITLIPASIALYDAMARNVRPDEKGAYRRYFRTFWQELGRGILMSLLWLVIAAVLFVGFRILERQAGESQGWAVYALVYQVLSLLPLGIFLWVIPLESRFVYPYWTLHKNAAVMMLSYLPRTFLMLVLTVAAFVGCWYCPFILAFVPGLLALLISIPVEKVFEKMTKED